jgi:hypothetical protein
VLRRIFGPKGDEVTGGWRKLHNEELHILYSSPKYGLESLNGRREYIEDLRIFARIILKWIFWKSGGKLWTGFIWLSKGMGVGLL